MTQLNKPPETRDALVLASCAAGVDDLARPRTFETEEVLYDALTVFWEKGYEATSLHDLLKATGLSKSSLYAFFGGKRDLFLKAFDTYREERVCEMNAILDKGAGREAISAFFGKVVNDAAAQSFRRGCMSTNQAVELATADMDIRDRVCSDFCLIESTLEKAIIRGQQDGSIASRRSSTALAEQLTVAFPGIQVLVRAGVATNKLKSLIHSTLACLD